MTYKPYTEIKSGGVENSIQVNNTGSIIPKATPLLVDAAGEIDFVDVSLPDAENFVGISQDSYNPNQQVSIISSGVLTNIDTSSFGGSPGDVIYVSKNGGLTNIKPDLLNGYSSGDLVIRVGVLAKNQANPSLIDLHINFTIIGRL